MHARCFLFLLGATVAPITIGAEHVILLHGLARSSASMERMQEALEAEGYQVANIDYASRKAAIEVLADEAIGRGLAACRAEQATTIHFVTHSLGGILVRSYLARNTVPELGCVVMLAPPNGGSEVVDALGDWAVFGWINGPAGREVGTDARAVPNRLGAADFSLGIIAGNRSINWINSAIIPGSDDGKVSVNRTKLTGMKDHLVLPVTHPFMMRDAEAIRQTLAFLRQRKFERR